MMMLLAPGLFRLDVRPVEDTLQVMTRSLHEGARWGTEPSAATDYGRKAEQTPEPARADFTFFAELEPRPILARIALTSTVDRERGLTHFVAQAIVREVEPGAVRWRSAGVTYPRPLWIATRSSARSSRPRGAATSRRPCDAHLRRVADELEALAAGPGSLAQDASARVQAIVAAAETSARQLRDDAEREAAEHVERVAEAARGLLERIDALGAELDGLRTGAAGLTASLDELRRDAGALGAAGEAAADAAEPARRASRPRPPRRPTARARRTRPAPGSWLSTWRSRAHRATPPAATSPSTSSSETSARCSTTSTRAPGSDDGATRAGGAARARRDPRRSRPHPLAAVLGPEHDDAAGRRGRARRPVRDARVGHA